MQAQHAGSITSRGRSYVVGMILPWFKLCIKFSWPTSPMWMGCRHLLWRIWYCVQWMLKTGCWRFLNAGSMDLLNSVQTSRSQPCGVTILSLHCAARTTHHFAVEVGPINWHFLMKLFYSNIFGHLYMSFIAFFCMPWNMLCSTNKYKRTEYFKTAKALKILTITLQNSQRGKQYIDVVKI